jgi:hypothetical protein
MFALVRALLALYDAKAARVKIEQLLNLVILFGSRAGDKSGGWGGGAAETCSGGDKFQEIEGDVFVATETATRILGLIHELPPDAMLPKIANERGTGRCVKVRRC